MLPHAGAHHHHLGSPLPHTPSYVTCMIRAMPYTHTLTHTRALQVQSLMGIKTCGLQPAARNSARNASGVFARLPPLPNSPPGTRATTTAPVHTECTRMWRAKLPSGLCLALPSTQARSPPRQARKSRPARMPARQARAPRASTKKSGGDKARQSRWPTVTVRAKSAAARCATWDDA